MPTDAKRQAVDELAEMLRGSSAMAVADYRGLKVSEMQTVRRSLRASGVELHVAKNRLLKIAADQAGRGELKSMLDGPTARRASPATRRPWPRRCRTPSDHTKVVTMRGGLLGSRPVDAASLDDGEPASRDVLLGKFAGGIASPSRDSPASWPPTSETSPAC